ncbi:hypothetical protein ACFWUW_06850 [Streptomyces sp. NPDC058655]|uniref:hypothetical protein n=1 Tax=Streptomyces sp. NPDC058655 TaxID=3346577 RepID=UPI003661C2E6
MSESGRGGAPQPGAPWGPDPAYPAQPDPDPAQAYPDPGGQPAQPGGPAYGYPQPGGRVEDAYGYPAPGYGYPQPGPTGSGHVVGPGYEGPGDPHGYGYPPLPDAVTQYIPPVPAGPGGPGEDATQYIPPVPAAPAQHEAATQYMPPVPAGPGGPGEDATQYIPPVPAAPAQHEAATQYMPPVPAGPGEAATQYIPPVPAAPARHEAPTQHIPPVPAGPGAEFEGLFRDGGESAGHTRQLPPVQEPVLRQQPRPRPHPPRAQGPVPHPQHPQPHPQPHPQFAPPPPPEAPRGISPGVIAAVVIGLAVVGLGVGALLGDGKPKNSDPGAVPVAPSSSGAPAAPGGEAPVDPGSPQAAQLDKLLADSNDSRAAVIKAVEDIKVCANLDQAAGDLRDAARQRQELVTRLKELKLDQLPDHAKLSAALTKAWQSSASADNSYAAWAQDVSGDKGCKDGKAKSTDNASAANKASGEATKSKEQAAVLWNRIAAKYSLTKRDKSQL